MMKQKARDLNRRVAISTRSVAGVWSVCPERKEILGLYQLG